MFVPPLPAVLFSDILSKGQALVLPKTDKHRKIKNKKAESHNLQLDYFARRKQEVTPLSLSVFLSSAKFSYVDCTENENELGSFCFKTSG